MSGKKGAKFIFSFFCTEWEHKSKPLSADGRERFLSDVMIFSVPLRLIFQTDYMARSIFYIHLSFARKRTDTQEQDNIAKANIHNPKEG